MNAEQIAERIVVLRRKLAKRDGALNMAENVKAIKAEIERLGSL